MKKVYQDKSGGAKADCLRACVASVLERDDVPNFKGDPEAMKRWAQSKGYTVRIEEGDPSTAPGGYVILGASKDPEGKEYGHCVVAKDGEKVHDPSGSPDYWEQLTPDYWIEIA